MSLQNLKRKLLKIKKFRDEYFKKDLAFEIGHMLLEARIEKNMTQDELAKKIGTQQPSIARVENGTTLPSLTFLEKIAQAFDSYLIPPTFGFMNDYQKRQTATNSLMCFMEITTVKLGGEDKGKDGSGEWYLCKECLTTQIKNSFKFCPQCGRKINWADSLEEVFKK